MGNNNVKQCENSLFSSEELSSLKNFYENINGNCNNLPKNKLAEKWNSLINDQLMNFTFNHLFGTGESKSSNCSFDKFVKIFYDIKYGTIEEKVALIKSSIGEANNVDELSVKNINNYIKAVIKTYITCISNENTNQNYSSWKKNGYVAEKNTIELWTQSFTNSLGSENDKIEMSKIERWLQVNPTFLIIWLKVYASLYEQEISSSSNLTLECLLPLCEEIPSNQNYSPIIELPQVMFLNSILPNEFRNKWRFLFSSKIHGQSFSTMLGKILGKYPTLFIIQDEDDYTFGGYAPAMWALSPKFTGDDTSMLFTLSPAMKFCSATSYNNHYQYLNLNQQTMPNGLGMGGQFNFWGLWLDCEYGIGHSSESCTTYRDYCQLSKKKDFKIKYLEVWAVGDEPRKDDDDDEETTKLDGNKSILDKHMEDKVMLQLAGQTLHSEGLREPYLDE